PDVCHHRARLRLLARLRDHAGAMAPDAEQRNLPAVVGLYPGHETVAAASEGRDRRYGRPDRLTVITCCIPSLSGAYLSLFSLKRPYASLFCLLIPQPRSPPTTRRSKNENIS